MKRKFHYALLILFVFSVASYSQKNDVGEANKTITEFKEKDPGMSKFFSSAYGYAVFPGIGKGGLGIGGAAGKGHCLKVEALLPILKCHSSQSDFRPVAKSMQKLFSSRMQKNIKHFSPGILSSQHRSLPWHLHQEYLLTRNTRMVSWS